MSSDCKFEVGKRYRNNDGTEVVIERVDGERSFNGVPMQIEGREGDGTLHTYQLNGQYLDDRVSYYDLIPEPIDDDTDEVVEVEPATADADEIAPGALVKPEQLELAREMCREGVEFRISSVHNLDHMGFSCTPSPDNDQYWRVGEWHMRRGPKSAIEAAAAAIDGGPQAAPADEVIDVEVIEAEPTSVLPDSGERSEFNTGAVRDAMSGKGVPSLVPPAAIRSLSRRFEDGATKYGRDNWLKGIPLSRYVDAIIRHTLAAAEGQTDEDHLGAVLWNAAAWIETERRIQCQQLPESLDDLPYRERHEAPQQVV